MNKEKILILDADSLIYMTAGKDSLEECLTTLEYRIMGIKSVVKCERVIGFLTSGKCFRYNIDSLYKYKREVLEKPKFYNTVKNYLIEHHDFIGINGLEADDLVSITRDIANNHNIPNIIASTDKDVLQQIPGKNFDYYISKESGTFRGFINTSEEDSIKFLFKQCLMGDSTDNIEGIKGIGLSKSEVILNKIGDNDFNLNTFDKYCIKTLNAYKEYYKNDVLALKELTKTLRLVYILRNLNDVKQELININTIEYQLNYIIKKLNIEF